MTIETSFWDTINEAEVVFNGRKEACLMAVEECGSYKVHRLCRFPSIGIQKDWWRVLGAGMCVKAYTYLRLMLSGAPRFEEDGGEVPLTYMGTQNDRSSKMWRRKESHIFSLFKPNGKPVVGSKVIKQRRD